MGYRGKVKEQEAARVLRAEGHTLADIATKLGVAKSSVSLWVRDVPFTPSPRREQRSRDGSLLLCVVPSLLRRRRATRPRTHIPT